MLARENDTRSLVYKDGDKIDYDESQYDFIVEKEIDCSLFHCSYVACQYVFENILYKKK